MALYSLMFVIIVRHHGRRLGQQDHLDAPTQFEETVSRERSGMKQHYTTSTIEECAQRNRTKEIYSMVGVESARDEDFLSKKKSCVSTIPLQRMHF
ncbi:hypothetical protein HZS_4971 [Henneguya salminicola]|nr:hypothetical protein HZS_4971 [Henneguya salminicola]